MKTIEQIAAELQGYDPQALSAERVNQFLAHLVEPVTATETVGVFEALDRVLAQDVISPISVPPHDNSAMDGFGFHSSQLQPGSRCRCAWSAPPSPAKPGRARWRRVNA